MNEKIVNLLAQMTIEEKIGQLIQVTGDFFQDGRSEITGPLGQNNQLSDELKYTIGSVLGTSGADDVSEIQKNYLARSRLKIPLLFMADIIHGYKTIFPIPLGLAATFDPEMMRTAAQVSAAEAAAGGVKVTFAPMTDLVRDPRWGRVMESTGEDPHLNAVMAAAAVKGFQGELPIDATHIAATVKHFAGYGAPEGGREYNTVDISEWRFRDQYLGAYQAAIAAQAKLVMTSFNTLFGVPATGNHYLMQTILRGELKFNGVLISDWNAIAELLAHGTAQDIESAAKKALAAGVDIDMMAFAYAGLLAKVDQLSDDILALIDLAVQRVLNLKDELGLFDDPYIGISKEKEGEPSITFAHEQQALKAAEASVVLVKNAKRTLPIQATQRVFLTGPTANTGDLLGSWSWQGDVSQTETLCHQLNRHVDYLSYLPGVAYHEDISTDWAAIKQHVASADVVVVALGLPSSESGEATSLSNPALPSQQVAFLKKIQALGKPIVTVVVTGRPLILSTVAQLSDALLISFFPGTKGAEALTNILLGKTEPTGRLPMTCPQNVGQIPLYYNDYNTGRPNQTTDGSGENRYMSKYLDVSNAPLFPFGFGLGYADIAIKQAKLVQTTFSVDDDIAVEVTLSNDAEIAGTTVLQCYTHQQVGETVRPRKELKWFKRLEVDAKQQRQVTICVPVNTLTNVHSDLTTHVDPGTYDIMVGLDSEHLHRLTCEIQPGKEHSDADN